MKLKSSDHRAARYAGQWVAISGGQVVAHGFDFHRVAEDACEKADDIAFELVPDPGIPFAHREVLPDDHLTVPVLPTGRRRPSRRAGAPPRTGAPPPPSPR